MKKTFEPTHALILIALLTLILSPRPISGTLDLRSADRYDAAGNDADAAQAYASAAARIPWMPSLWEKAGVKAMQGGDVENAITFLNKAVKRHAISEWGWLYLGMAYQKRGELSLAVKAWEEALPLAQAYSYLASAERSLGNIAEAIEYWRAHIALEPENAAAHYTLGLLLTATAPEQALPELMQAVNLNPDLDISVQSLRTALNTAFLSDDRPYQFLVSGRALGALGEWDLAVEAFRNAIAWRFNYAEAWAWLGEAEQQQGQDGSLEIEQALTFGPESAMVQGLYGLYLQHQGQPDAALAAFHKAADLEPDNPGWQMALGSASEQTGDLVAAYGYYFHAVELAPADASTWRALVAFSVTNDVDVDGTGLPAARKLVGLAPNDWQSYDLAGQAEFLLEDYTAAETYLKKAVQMSPSQAAPALHLGLVYMQTGDRTSAYSYLNLARTFDPDGPYGWQAGRLLEQYFP
ncbi:MAG: tetratricopeptide repeat protein [Anaerolineales bacterium]